MYGRVAVFWRSAAEGTLIGGMTVLMKIHSSENSRVFAKSHRPVLTVAVPLNYK